MAKRLNYDGIQPDRKNANKGTERGRYMVEASLRETGAGRSILLDKEGRIVAGNKTFEAASDIGLPVRIVETDGTELVAVKRTDLDLDDDTGTARKLAYYDNRAAQVGLEWDAEQMLADLGAGLDLSAMFRADELDELLADLTPKTTGDTEPQVDKADELREKWSTAPGQLWALGEHRLICGDCTDAATVARVMGGERAALGFADPPYGAGVAEWDKVFVWDNDYMADLCGVVVVTPGIVSIPEFMRKTSMPYKWSVGGWITNGRARSAIGFGNWIYGAVFSKDSVYRCNQDFCAIDLVPGQREDAQGHRGQKPLPFMEWIVELFSAGGDIVYDPFLGSGTTLIACHNLNRRCQACEISPAYTAVCLQRFFDHTQITPVLLETA